jgi:hypothetical protein
LFFSFLGGILTVNYGSTIYHYRVPYNNFFPILFCVGYYILKKVPAVYDTGSIFQFATSHNTSTIYHYRVPYNNFFPILFCVGYYILKNVPAIYDTGLIFQFATSHNTSTIYHYRVPYTHYGKFWLYMPYLFFVPTDMKRWLAAKMITTWQEPRCPLLSFNRWFNIDNARLLTVSLSGCQNQYNWWIELSLPYSPSFFSVFWYPWHTPLSFHGQY